MMDNTPGRLFPAIKIAECANKLSTVDCRFFCTLCREPLQGRSPKLLPCFHTFCLSCLTTLVEEAAAKLPAAVPCDNNDAGIKRKQRTDEVITNESISDLSATDQEGKQGTDNSDQITKEVTFDCPSCRYRVTVPQEGVSGLQTNVYLDTDAAPISPRLPECEMCEVDDKKKASYTCVECGIAICTRCRRFHDVVGGAQSHRIFHLGSGQTAITRTSRKRWCPYHPDQWLSFNCRQCRMIICMFCKLTSHDGHITEDIISATVRAKEDAMHLIASAKEQILILESVRGHLERDKKELARQKEEVIHGVSARFENIISLATRARDEFLERLELDEETALRKLNTDQTVVRCTVEKLLDLVSRVNGPASECSEPDVIQLSADLQATILHEVDLHHYRERVNASRGPVYFAHRTDESALDIENVRAYVGVMGDIDGSSSGPPVTLREIRRSVAEVTKLVEELQSEKASKTDVEKWRAKGSKMEKEIADIKDNMETLVNAKLQEVARKIETKLIAFNVRMEQRVTAVGDKPIPFDVIECNDGDGYDQHTGIFTVPLSGTYVFLASIYSSSNVAFYICVDGARVVQSVGYSFCFSANLVKKLRVGQQVSLQFSGAYYVESTPQTYFTGAIIQASA